MRMMVITLSLFFLGVVWFGLFLDCDVHAAGVLTAILSGIGLIGHWQKVSIHPMKILVPIPTANVSTFVLPAGWVHSTTPSLQLVVPGIYSEIDGRFLRQEPTYQ